MNGIIVDIICVTIILLFAVAGVFKGFFKSITSLMGVGLAVTITYLLRTQILDIDKGIGIASSLSKSIGEAAGAVLTIVIYGIIVYILLKIVVIVLNLTVGKILQGKFFGGINKFFGFIFGIVKGAFTVLSLLFIMSALLLIPNIKENVTSFLQGSNIVSPIVDYISDNVLPELIDKVKSETTEPTPDDTTEDRSDALAVQYIFNNETHEYIYYL